MDRKQRILFHQIHPAKLATDIVSCAVSLYFFWEHQLVIALLTHIAPPVVATLLLLRYGNFDGYETTAAGRYVVSYMTRPFEVIRLAGDFFMVLGAWGNNWRMVLAGLVVVVAAWANGFLRPKHIL